MSVDPLNALRRSDPARRVVATSPADLDRALAELHLPDAAGPTRRSRRLRHPFWVLGASLVAAGSVAVAAGVRPWQRDESRQAGPGLVDGDANAAQLRDFTAATRALTLPPGVRWKNPPVIPPDTIIGTGRGGAGEGYAVFYAFNAWACEAVRAHDAGDGAGVRRATAALTTIVDRHFVVVPEGTPEDGAAPADVPGPIVSMAPAEPSPLVMFHGWIRAAGRGDVRQLRQSCVVNRPGG